MTEKKDLVPELKDDFPNRYSSREVNGMDVIDLCKHWNLNFEGNILKYLLEIKAKHKRHGEDN
jgi:hypothetical protein